MVTMNKKSLKSSRKLSSRKIGRLALENLEKRELFTLVGVMPSTPSTSIVGPDGSLTYSASTHAFDVTGTPVSMLLSTSPFKVVPVGTPSSFDLHITVSNAGTATSGAGANDFVLTGTVDTNGDGTADYSGVLLTGKVTQFGYEDAGTNDNFDFRFTVTGGSLAPAYFVNKDAGLLINSENSTFAGNFNSDFKALTKATLGPIDQPAGTPPIVISGHKYLDQSGNGLSCDDTSHPLAGVTIQLYRDTNSNGVIDSGDTLVASQVTDANGAYSFTNLAGGTYFVKEVQQAGYVETGPTSGMYTVQATKGSYANLDFDNFKTDVCPISCISYTINGCKTVSSLNGNVHQGDTIKVNFTVSAPDTISFVAYTAPNGNFDAANLQAQQIFSVATGTYAKAGNYSLTITVPDCYFQVDLVCGLPIDHFGPAGSNIFYHAQDRYIDGIQGGTNCMCTSNASISGSVYVDCNNDGKKSSGEAGIAGVKVTLTGTTANGNVTLTTTTDAYGNYSFSKLAAGTYTVTETDPTNYADGAESAGTAGGTVGNDVISNIVLSSNTCATGYNFGETNTTTVCGNSGHGGCKVTMTGCDSWGRTCSWTTTCDNNGNYSFGNVCGGNYKVQECDSRNNCTATKSFCLDASKYTNCSANVNTLCNTSLSSIISQILSLLSRWF